MKIKAHSQKVYTRQGFLKGPKNGPEFYLVVQFWKKDLRGHPLLICRKVAFSWLDDWMIDQNQG